MHLPFCRAVAASCLLLGSVSSAWALAVQGYDASVNERFVSGFPNGPIVTNADPDFTLAGYDLSGVGWQTASSSFAVTLISPRHALTAAHAAPGVGSSVTFLGADGVLRNYTVSSVTTLTYTNSDNVTQNTDVALVRLSTPVNAQIRFYYGLYLSNPADYLGMPVTLYGAGGRAGVNTVDAVGEADLLPFGSGNGVDDSAIAVMDYDAVSGQAQAQAGDSGSPTFARIANGDLAFFGTHSAIDGSSSPQKTYDSLPVYSFDQINGLLGADGYSWAYYTGGVVASIPEPASVAWLLGGAALASTLGLRRRGRQ